jgi:hypothetical protein
VALSTWGVQFRLFFDCTMFEAFVTTLDKDPEVIAMDHIARLQLAGRITYYLGWIALVCGGLAHANIGRSLFMVINLSKRNLFEISIISFVICIASALRALIPGANEMPTVVKRPAAA